MYPTYTGIYILSLRICCAVCVHPNPIQYIYCASKNSHLCSKYPYVCIVCICVIQFSAQLHYIIDRYIFICFFSSSSIHTHSISSLLKNIGSLYRYVCRIDWIKFVFRVSNYTHITIVLLLLLYVNDIVFYVFSSSFFIIIMFCFWSMSMCKCVYMCSIREKKGVIFYHHLR